MQQFPNASGSGSLPPCLAVCYQRKQQGHLSDRTQTTKPQVVSLPCARLAAVKAWSLPAPSPGIPSLIPTGTHLLQSGVDTALS